MACSVANIKISIQNIPTGDIQGKLCQANRSGSNQKIAGLLLM